MDESEKADLKRRTGIQSVEIGAQVLFEVANVGRPVALSDLSRRLAMPAPNVRRYLVSLVTAGLIEQDALTLKYHLGLSSIRLGLAAMSQRPDLDLAIHVATALRDEVDCCVGLLCPGELGPVMVRWLENEDRVTHVGKIGATFSMVHSASGRAYLAQMPNDVVQAAFHRETRAGERPTDNGRILDMDAFAAHLQATKSKGYSHVRGDYTAGIEAVGALAFNAAGEVAFILTLVGRMGIFDPGSKPHAPEALKEAAARLSGLLGNGEQPAPIAFPVRPMISHGDM